MKSGRGSWFFSRTKRLRTPRYFLPTHLTFPMKKFFTTIPLVVLIRVVLMTARWSVSPEEDTSRPLFCKSRPRWNASSSNLNICVIGWIATSLSDIVLQMALLPLGAQTDRNIVLSHRRLSRRMLVKFVVSASLWNTALPNTKRRTGKNTRGFALNSELISVSNS